MKRTVNLGATGILDKSEFVLEIKQEKLAIWAMELTLLIEDYVQELRILLEDQWSLTLSVNADPEAIAAMKRTGERSLSCELPRNEAGHFQAVLLRAYRDGMAETGHIHIEGYLDGHAFDLTPVFDTHAPPMSAEEAEKIILGNR